MLLKHGCYISWKFQGKKWTLVIKLPKLLMSFLNLLPMQTKSIFANKILFLLFFYFSPEKNLIDVDILSVFHFVSCLLFLNLIEPFCCGFWKFVGFWFPDFSDFFSGFSFLYSDLLIFYSIFVVVCAPLLTGIWNIIHILDWLERGNYWWCFRVMYNFISSYYFNFICYQLKLIVVGNV